MKKNKIIDIDRAAVEGDELVLEAGFFRKRQWRLRRKDIIRIQAEEAYPYLGAVMLFIEPERTFNISEGSRDFEKVQRYLRLDELFGAGWRECAIANGQIWKRS